MGEALAILPKSLGHGGVSGAEGPSSRVDAKKFMPAERGALLLKDPNEKECPYTFSDSPAYTQARKAEKEAKRSAELEGRDETRGFLRTIEELGRRQKWDDAYQTIERRTAVPSGLFLVTRAALRWHFTKFGDALVDAEDAVKTYGSSASAGPLAAAFNAFGRICLGSSVRNVEACSREMRPLIAAWELAERDALHKHAAAQGLFRPRREDRMQEPCPVPGAQEAVEARDGLFTTAQGVRLGYVFLRSLRDAFAPFVLHFPDASETAADYRRAVDLAGHSHGLARHMLVVDYRGYGWSTGEPSLVSCLRDVEPLAERLGELLVEQGLPWPYRGGVVVSGRGVGAHVAVHLATLFPQLFRALVLDSAAATSAVSGDRLGRAPERAAVFERWRIELEKASLDVIDPLAADFHSLSDLEKIRSFDGRLLVVHGLADEAVPYEASESLHGACPSKQKELVLIEGAGRAELLESEAYWSAQRRFYLKLQVEGAETPTGEHAQHLCAVCAEKASSKCGRCQRVWYCSRKHQADHWKAHKSLCGPEPSPAEPKVGEACLVAALVAEVENEEDAAVLARSLESLAAQRAPAMHGVYVAWHATSALQARLRVDLAQAGERCKAASLTFEAIESPVSRPPFEHLKTTLGGALAAAPASAWVVLPERGELWSPNRADAWLSALRAASVDFRVLAVSCRRRAQPAVNKSDRLMEPTEAAAVAIAIESGASIACDAAPRLADHAVRAIVLRGFLEGESLAVLRHHLCASRILYRLSHTFGKKVKEFVPAEAGEWMRWAPFEDEDLGRSQNVEDAEFDESTGQELWQGLRHAVSQKLSNEESAVALIRALRRAVELAVIRSVGEQLSGKELRSLVSESVDDILQQKSLDEVVGLRRRLLDVAAAMGERAVQDLGFAAAPGSAQ